MFRSTALLFPLAASLCGQAVPITVHGVLAIATVRLNGQGPFRMLIDTGASSCSIRPDIAKALRLEPEYRVIEVTVAGERTIPGAKSVRVEIGDRIENGVEFVWQEPSDLALDGVLGQSLLSRFNYLLDYKAKQFFVDATETRGKRISFESVARRILLSALSPEEGGIRLVLDSGASHLLLWRVPAIGVSQTVADVMAMNGRRSASLVHIPLLVVGGHALLRLDAAVLPRSGQMAEDGLLPAALFRSVYVSNSEGYVKLAQ